MKLIFLDFEVMKLDWLVCITEKWLEDGEEKTNDLVICNDRPALIRYYFSNYKNSIFIGHNIGRYDYPIFISILEGLNPKEVNDKIINSKEHWKMLGILPNYKNYTFNYIDTCQDSFKIRLKEFEGYVDLPIVTTEVAFDIDRKLTQEELDLTIKYCKADVHALIRLFEEEKASISTKIRLIEQYNMPTSSVSLSNAQLVDNLLATSQMTFNDELDPFDFDSIPVVPATKRVIDFYSQPVNYSNNFSIRLNNIWLNYAYGGLHGALPNFKYEGEIWLADVSSLYPSIMIYYDFFSRNMNTLSKRKYIDFYFGRRKNKADNNEELKLVVDEQTNFFKMFTQYGAFEDGTDWSVEHRANSKQADVSKLVLKYWAQV